VRAYLSDPERNHRRAAQAAGYSPSAGARLLRDPRVQQAIRRYEQRLNRRANVKAERIIQQLMTIVEATVSDFVWDEATQQLKVRDGLPPERIQAVASLKRLRGGGVQWRLWPKLEAIRLLGLHLGMFREKQEQPQQTKVYMLPVVALNTTEWQRVVAQRKAAANGEHRVADAELAQLEPAELEPVELEAAELEAEHLESAEPESAELGSAELDDVEDVDFDDRSDA
jgi:hypothetical protein